MSARLPILDQRDSVVSSLKDAGRLVVTAPTGSGKSTQLPQALLDSGAWPGQVLVLEPRRMAARMLARRVAEERGTRVGEEVGYRVRFDGMVSAGTRIVFVTEGLLLRQLLSEPDLPGVSALVFDEFHERNLAGDLALALAKRLTETSRPDLVLLVTSATLEAEPLCEYLGDCPLVEVEGRLHPVEVSYWGGEREAPAWDRAAKQVAALAPETEGDFLVFMPGAYEIRRTLSALERSPRLRGFDLLPLYGELPPDRQDAALRPSSRRKVVVATNVAETSLTIEGVRVVVDSGVAKEARYDSRRGVNVLLPEPISRASAKQRAGRAGRTAPGRCLRLWSEKEHEGRTEARTPEVKRVDLSETCLALRAAGKDLRSIDWFEAPETEALDGAEELLAALGAFDEAGELTERGRSMAAFPVHPRHARALVEARERGCLPAVALALALAQDRSILLPLKDKRRETEREDLFDASRGELESDFFRLLQAWSYAAERNFRTSDCVDLGIHAGRCREAARLAKRFTLAAGLADDSDLTCDPAAFAKCMLAAFPEHVGKRRSRGMLTYALANGKNAELRRSSAARDAELVVAAELDEAQARGKVSLLLGLATEIREEWLEEAFPGALVRRDETYFDEHARTVARRSALVFRELALREEATGEPTPEEAARALAEEILAGRLRPKKWNAEAERFVARVQFAAKHCPELEVEPFDEEARRLLWEQFCLGEKTWRPLRNKEVLPLLKEWLSPEQAAALESLVPETITLPGRKRPVPLRYDSEGDATLAATVQDLYEVRETPVIAGGRYPLRMEILAPSRRPVQVTRDLASFWESSYAEVKRDLAGRYPKHEWR